MKKKIILLTLSLAAVSMAPYMAYAADAEQENTSETASEATSDEGGLVVTQKYLIELPGKSSAYFYAKVENTSNEEIYCDHGTMVTFSANDDLLTTSDTITTSPSRVNVQPGGYVYLYESIWDDILEDSDIADYKFSIGAADSGNDYISTSCEATMGLSGADSYDNYIYVTFTNDTSETIWNYNVATALYDSSDQLIYVDSNYYETVGVPSGSSITVKQYVDSDIMEYFNDNSIVPVVADATVYILATA